MTFVGVVYLNLDLVLSIHAAQLQEHGGMSGIRDQGGLESALAQPEASFGDEDFHVTVFDKAAAYAFHLAESQAFIDGNKRVALASALVFLALNGYEITEDQPAFYDAMIAIAKRDLDKEGLSNLFRDAWIKLNLSK